MQPVPIYESNDHDHSEIEIVRDTTIITEPDSATIRALFKCDSANNALLAELSERDGKRIDAGVYVKQNSDGSIAVEFNCKEDSLINEIQIRDKIISDLRKEKEVVRVEVVPDYYRNTSAGFWVLLSILVVLIGAKIARIYFKIQSGGIL